MCASSCPVTVFVQFFKTVEWSCKTKPQCSSGSCELGIEETRNICINSWTTFYRFIGLKNGNIKCGSLARAAYGSTQISWSPFVQPNQWTMLEWKNSTGTNYVTMLGFHTDFSLQIRAIRTRAFSSSGWRVPELCPRAGCPRGRPGLQGIRELKPTSFVFL